MRIELEDITKKFQDKIVFDGFSDTLEIDGIVCVCGPSGSGKTTLLRMLAGLAKPDGGRITGMPTRVSVLFQEDRLLPWYSAKKNIALASDEGRAILYLQKVGLAAEAEALPAALSGGMKRRIALARALAFAGELVLLDEPLHGLDVGLKQEMLALLRDESTRRPILLITHDLEEVAAVADTVLVLSAAPVRQAAQIRLETPVEQRDAADRQRYIETVRRCLL